MAMSAPSVVNMAYAQWITGTGSHPITVLGTIQTDPSIDSSIQGGTAQVFYDQVANQICIDNLT